jgi:hypothetical protein
MIVSEPVAMRQLPKISHLRKCHLLPPLRLEHAHSITDVDNHEHHRMQSSILLSANTFKIQIHELRKHYLDGQ